MASKGASVFTKVQKWNRRKGPAITLSKSLSRSLFGNEAGFANNIDGIVKTGRARSAGFGARDALTRDFLRDGFAVLPYRIDVEAFKDQYLTQIEDPEFSLGRGRRGASRMLKAPEKTLPAYRSVMSDAVRQTFSDAYLGNFEVFSFHLYRTHHVVQAAGEQVYSDFWHFDWRSTAQYRLFFNLSDVTADDGPLLINSIDRSKTLVKSGQWKSRLEYDGQECDREATALIGPPGTAMICNTTLCLHRASVPAAGRTRDISSVQFMPARHALPDDWMTGLYQNP